MVEKITRLGVMGFIGVAVVLTAVFVVVYSTVTGAETETSKLFATALSGTGIGGLLVAVGRSFGGD